MIRAITDEMKREYIYFFKLGRTIPFAIEGVEFRFGVKHSRQLIHQSVRTWVRQGLLESLPPSAKAGRKPKCG